MNNSSAEQLAIEVLKKIKNEYGKIEFPIDPFDLLKREDVLVTLSDFDRLEGIILSDVDNLTIVGINRNRQWTRQRFTAAHEYCHYIKDIGDEENKSRQIDCLIGSKSKIEKFADAFASSLLMPRYKVNELCRKYQNKKGYIDFETVTLFADYFGVSFRSCLNRLAYDFGKIDGDISPAELNRRIQKYGPEKKRRELIKKSKDLKYINNLVDSMNYTMIDLATNTGNKFLNNYIYFDNRIEGLNVKNVPFIIADLNINKEKSKFYNSKDEKIIMTIGDYRMQEYILTTNDKISILDCKHLHKLLNSYMPYPEYSGLYRDSDAVILNGSIQPCNYIYIDLELKQLDNEFKEFIKTCSTLKISEYVSQIVKFVYRFTWIHPFADGNGRISRALLNWMLRLKSIPPIYVDDDCRDEYYNALSSIDTSNDYNPFVIFVEKRIINTMIELHDYLFLEE